MPLTKARRPKYERQDVKQNLFTIQLSNQRLDKIRRLLKNQSVDALLIIIGIDGRFNSGSLEIFNFLLFDVYSTRKDDIERSKLDDDVFDDVMLCIQVDEVHVYCNGANYWLLLPYISHWSGLRLHCISEIEMEDPDKVEDFKMRTFVEMTRRCTTIAVSMKAQYEADREPFDPMRLEEWPIVQSYAYDDFGTYSFENTKKGFFTLVHKVVDLSKDVNRICRQVDPVYLENIYTKVLPQVEGLFENIFQLIDTKCFSKELEINEEILEEPVNSYYSHYKGTHARGLDKIKMYPFVVSGRNTKSSILSRRMNDRPQNNRDKMVKDPTHLIMQCVNVQTGIVVTRTAFLKCSTSDQTRDDTASLIDDKTRELSKVYREIVKTVEYVINRIKTEKKLNLDIIDGVNHLKSKLNGVQYSDSIFRILQVNDETQRDCSMIIIQGVVFDVLSESTKENLGSVMFADTFVVSCSPMTKDEDLTSVLRLGKEVPIFNYWIEQRLSELHNSIRTVYNLDPIGTENVEIFLPNDNFNEELSFNACCTFYLDRLLLFNRRIGASLIHPQSIEIFEGESYGDWTICTLKFQRDESSSNWIWNNNEQSCLHMIFTNHSSARKIIMNSVIPKWKSTMSVCNIEKLSNPSLDRSWTNIQLWMINQVLPCVDDHSQSIIDGISDETNRSTLAKCLQSMNNSITNRRSCVRTFCRILELSYSLHYLKTVNYLEEIPTRSPQFYESLEQSWQTESIMDISRLGSIKKETDRIECGPTIVVTVLCGLPGGGHEQISRKITKLIKEDISWLLVDSSTLESVPSAVEKAISRFLKLDAGDEGRKLRMILMAPPMCSPAVICETLMGLHTKLPLEIGSTCICIDPQVAYMNENELTIPGLLDMCDEGWVTCILLTGSDPNSKSAINLQRLLKSRNDLCTVFCTPKAEINKELDTVLSPVAYQQARFASSRILMKTGIRCNEQISKHIRKIGPELFQVTFPLCGPLSKDNVIDTCKEIFKSIKSCPFDGNIYFLDGIFGIEEDPRNQFSFSAATLSKQISFLPCKKNLSDDGVIRDSEDNYIRVYTTNIDFDKTDPIKTERWIHKLLTVMRKCQKQRSEKKARLTKQDVTHNCAEGIHKLRHLEPLPEGWFYNGLTFVHMDGTKSDKHPKLSEFIDEYLERENAAIEKHNAVIDKMSFVDSFSKF